MLAVHSFVHDSFIIVNLCPLVLYLHADCGLIMMIKFKKKCVCVCVCVYMCVSVCLCVCLCMCVHVCV